MSMFRKFALLVALTIPFAAVAAAPPIPAFTAHYRLLRNGSQIGTATVTLAPAGDGTWRYSTQSRGTAGLASLLGASVNETSTFRWVGDLPQGETYTYSMDSAVKQKHRSVRFDWSDHTITVDDKGTHHFATQPGALERHTVALALAAGLAAGKSSFTLPVAVRDRIQAQHYVVRGEQNINVPAGSFKATEIVRTDGGDAFEAWFAPGKVPVPVKLDQRGKHEFSLELESWSKG